MGTSQTHKRSIELAKQFKGEVSKDELKTLIKKHEAFANASPTYDEYLRLLQDELNPNNFLIKYSNK